MKIQRNSGQIATIVDIGEILIPHCLHFSFIHLTFNLHRSDCLVNSFEHIIYIQSNVIDSSMS